MNADGPSNVGLIQLNGANARPGATNTGQADAQFMANYKMGQRQHFAQPPNPLNNPSARRAIRDGNGSGSERDIPYWMGHYGGDNVPYSIPTAEKENFQLREEVIDGINQMDKKEGNVLRTAPVTQGEVDMLKTMKDQAELSKFDQYVESFIDPKQPGNMQWLMKVYPQYVQRRLQQTHTDYEFALRNHMIDSWGINTFDDLHFKYLIDQGELKGPTLGPHPEPIDAWYTPGYLSPWKFTYGPSNGAELGLPYSAGVRGHKTTVDRAERQLPMSDHANMASGMYRRPTRRATQAPWSGPEAWV